MRKTKAKRLYWKALHRYREGYIDGTQSAARARANEGSRIPHLTKGWYRDDSAFSAGHDAGMADERIDRDRLPLDVWALVLAAELQP